MRMIGTMAGAGVSLMDCVETAQGLCCATVITATCGRAVITQIQAGKQMSEPISRTDLVRQSVAQMIHSGEKGGKLAYVMEQISRLCRSRNSKNASPT